MRMVVMFVQYTYRPRHQTRRLRARSRSAHSFVQSNQDIYCPLVSSITSNVSVSWQRMSRLACADAHVDLNLRCLYMPKRHLFEWYGIEASHNAKPFCPGDVNNEVKSVACLDGERFLRINCYNLFLLLLLFKSLSSTIVNRASIKYSPMQ